MTRWSRVGVGVGVLLGWAGGASGAPGTPAPEPGDFPFPIHSEVLDNGLVIHVVEMPSPGVVAWYASVAVGSRDEVDPGRTGFAHFFEHLMFYGTEALGREARERAVLRLGLEENAWTWFDETVYHAVLPASQLDAYLAMEADRFQNLALTAEDVRREAGAVYGELRKSQASPETTLDEALLASAFTVHTYRHDTIGYEADIAAMPTAHAYAQAFFDRYYRPENVTLLVVGDVRPEAVLARVAERWSGWERATVPRAEIPVEPPQTASRQVDVTHPGPTAPRLTLAWRIAGHDPDDPTLAALELASRTLLASIGPLKERLLREEGLAYAVWGERQSFVDPCLFRIDVKLKDVAHFDRAEAIVREEIARLVDGVDPELLDRVRSNARYADLTALDSPGEVASALGWALRRSPLSEGNPLDRFRAGMDAVDPARLAEAVGRTLIDAHLTRVRLRGAEPEASP